MYKTQALPSVCLHCVQVHYPDSMDESKVTHCGRGNRRAGKTTQVVLVPPKDPAHTTLLGYPRLMPCPVCTSLEARLDDLHKFYRRVSAVHLKAVQAEDAGKSRQYEEIILSYSDAIKQTEGWLKGHRLLCGVV